MTETNQIGDPDVIAASTTNMALPKFWSADPQLWFVHVEAQFQLNKIKSDEKKFNYIIASMACEDLKLVADILPQQPDYEKLKATLIKRCSISDADRVKTLLSGIELGDRKPSQLLRELRLLSTSGTPDEVIKQLWLQRLPLASQTTLLAFDINLDQLGDIADRISSVSQHNISSLQETSSSLSQEVEQLREEINKMKKNLHRSPSPQRKKYNKSSFCWYHEQFKNRARKCQPPCSFRKSEN